nr:hypothetical protein [Tanacetum cinerariifolium]
MPVNTGQRRSTTAGSPVNGSGPRWRSAVNGGGQRRSPVADHRSTVVDRQSTGRVRSGQSRVMGRVATWPTQRVSRQLSRQHVGPMSAHVEVPCQLTGSHMST